MRLLVISDVHGDRNDLEYLLKKETYDAVIFCGDGLRDVEKVSADYPQIQFYTVRGNCDYADYAPESFITAFEEVAVFVAHGNMHGVKSGIYGIVSEAKSREADLVLFGHTHRAVIENENGITVMNPGSVCDSGTYGIVNIEKGKFTCEIKEIF